MTPEEFDDEKEEEDRANAPAGAGNQFGRFAHSKFKPNGRASI